MKMDRNRNLLQIKTEIYFMNEEAKGYVVERKKNSNLTGDYQ